MTKIKGKKRLVILLISILAIGASIIVGREVSIDRPTKSVVAVRTAFDPSNFVGTQDLKNEYQPLTPGLQLVRSGSTEVGSRKVPHQIISTVTDVIRVIDGVTTVAVLDQSEDSGETSQIGIDYLAIDKDRNVWMMGSYTEDYESGQFSNANGAFLGKSSGGEPGILLPATVTMQTPRWFIGSPGPKEEPSVAEPVAVGQNIKVAFGQFHNVRAVVEGAASSIENEIKYYAPGVGVILNVPKDKSLHQDDFELINIIMLTPKGLSDASQTVLNLEEHARTVSSEVYGNAPKGQRSAQKVLPIQP